MSKHTPNLDSCSLLPPTFRTRDRIRQAAYGWLTVLAALLILLIGVVSAAALRHRRARAAMQALEAQIMPLIALRDQTRELNELNQMRETWCELAESTRPDDSALQTLAAVAQASQSGRIQLESITIQLPQEETVTRDKESAQVDSAAIEIMGRVEKTELRAWIDQLDSNGRITGVARDENQILAPPPHLVPSADHDDGSQVLLKASALTSRILP